VKKIIELDDYFPTGEATVQPVLVWNGGKSVDTSRITKYASDALDYIKSVVPEPGKTIMLVNALGAEETWGPNRNGDGFPEHPVPAKLRGKTASTTERWFIEPGQELTKHYQTFETNPAHCYQHHRNRDPNKASGIVKKAFWNPKMHRVELLISVDNDKDPDWVKRANDGEYPAVSMGTRIKWDVCARCGNKAPTRADYCDHAKYAMNEVDEHGFKNYVHNPSPDFFDISRVFRPADRTGYTLKKVAQVHEVRLSADLAHEADMLAAKAAAATKLSDIDKIIRGEPVATSTLSPDERSLIIKFRDHVGSKLASSDVPYGNCVLYPLGEILSAAAINGVVLKDAEFIPLAASKLAGKHVTLTDDVVAKTAAAARRAVELFADDPGLLDEVLSSGALESEKVASYLIDTFASVREKRAYVGDYLYRRLVPEGTGMRPDAAATTDMLHAGPYQTTRGAAIDAQDAVTRAHIGKVLGGSAMLLGGYKALTAFPALRKFKLPIAAGLGYGGYKALSPRSGGTIQTDEGLRIPDITEMTGRTASVESIASLVENAADRRTRGPVPKVAMSGDAESIATLLGAAITGFQIT
jgi:hypothetical protein